MKLPTQVVGNVGLYYVCFHLSRRGWNVMPTARNARGIDVVAYDATGEQFVGVQVKALSKRAPVPLGKDLEKVMGDYWVVVNDLLREPKPYVLLPSEVRDLAHRGEKEGRISYWLQPKDYATPQFEGAWDRIGLGHNEA